VARHPGNGSDGPYSVDAIAVMKLAIRNGKWQRGSVVITVGLMLTVLIGFAGLAIDVGSLYSHKRAIQTAADGGALEAAVAIKRGDPATGEIRTIADFARRGTSTNGFTHGVAGVEVLVNRPPASGPYSGNSSFVEVIVNQPSPSYFMRVLGFLSTPVAARAVAGVGAATGWCIQTLIPTGIGFRSTSNSRITANCGVIVNSSSNEALKIESNAILTASNIDITGGFNKSSGSTLTPAPNTGVPPAPDPLATLQPPTNANAACLTFPSGGKWEINNTQTLYPGVYCGGIFVQSSGVVTFAPGTYVLRGGSLVGNALKVDGQIKGDGVTFFVTASSTYEYKPIALEGSSRVNLSAPTTGSYAGILFHQDPSKGTTSDINRVNSSSNVVLSGLLYFPTQMLQLNSNNITITGTYLGIIVRQLEVNSSTLMELSWNNSNLPGEFPLRRVTLVE
jgi:hypothetical protein